jgi:hypothetical protein
MLLQSGDLEAMFPTLTGVWESDMKEFKILYEENKRIEEEDFDAFFLEDYEDYE